MTDQNTSNTPAIHADVPLQKGEKFLIKLGKWIKKHWKGTGGSNVIAVLYTIATIVALIVAISTLRGNQTQFEIVNSPNLSLGNVAYFYGQGEKPLPLTPHQLRRFQFQIKNYGKRLVHIRNFKCAILFDTATAAINSWVEGMKNDNNLISNNCFVPASDMLEIVEPFAKNPSANDSVKILVGNCTFYLEVEYVNDITHRWRTYTIVTSLRDQHGPYSLVEHEYYNENRDTCICRPLP